MAERAKEDGELMDIAVAVCRGHTRESFRIQSSFVGQGGQVQECS